MKLFTAVADVFTKADLVVGDSSIDRTGVFAGKSFKKGSVIHELDGKEVDIAEIERIYLNGFNRITVDGYQLSDEHYLFLDAFSCYINHSCNPTCGVVGRSTLIALRDIAEGEEITYDYSTVEWTPKEYTIYDHKEWPMECRCGQESCRNFIACFPCLPESVKQKYISAGLIPNHIKAKLELNKKETGCLNCEHEMHLRTMRSQNIPYTQAV